MRTVSVEAVVMRSPASVSTAELEKGLIQERVVAGVRRAQAAGKHCGRPRKASGTRGRDT